MDASTRSFVDLPHWAGTRDDKRAGFIDPGADGRWRAKNWTGPLGIFETAEEAEAAIRPAPAKPKLKRPPRAEPPIRLQFEGLTANEAGYSVLDARKRKIGAVNSLASGQFAAWSRSGKIGEFATPGQAEIAVRVADRADPSRK